MRIVEYDYTPEFASAMGINSAHQTGIHVVSLLDLVLLTTTIVLPSLAGGCVLWHLIASC